MAVLAVLAACLAVVQIVARSASFRRWSRLPETAGCEPLQVGAFLKVGALTFGGGLTMIAFMQEQVVSQFTGSRLKSSSTGWLGQFTPGPILMVAAYVAYKVAGVAGAVVGGAARSFRRSS